MAVGTGRIPTEKQFPWQTLVAWQNAFECTVPLMCDAKCDMPLSCTEPGRGAPLLGCREQAVRGIRHARLVAMLDPEGHGRAGGRMELELRVGVSPSCPGAPVRCGAVRQGMSAGTAHSRGMRSFHVGVVVFFPLGDREIALGWQ